MASCGDYKTMIQLYLDHELTGSDLQDLLSHLETCGNCRREMEELKAFSTQIQEARPLFTASASLRERILTQTANQKTANQEEEKRKTPGEAGTLRQFKRPASTQLSQSRSWLPAAIAAMLCLAAGITFSILHSRAEANALSFVDTAIVAHRGITDASMSLDVRSSSPKVVSDWFTSKVPFSFRMPDAGMASEDGANYQLTGGRLLTFGGEQAALVAFQMHGDMISILISSEKKANAMGGKVTYSNGIRFHSNDRDNFHVVTWENKHLVYALIFPNKLVNQHSCSTCHQSSVQPRKAKIEETRWSKQ
jgi:anti-sigma factor RsiW